MLFMDKKEEVIDIELTPYGKHTYTPSGLRAKLSIFAPFQIIITKYRDISQELFWVASETSPSFTTC